MDHIPTERGAVFYDVDGTLVHTNIVYVYIQYALRLPTMRDRFKKLLISSLSAPVYVVSELLSRGMFNRIFYSNYKGIAEERLRLLGREIARDGLLPNLYADARERIRHGKAMGLMQVLVSGSLDYVLEPMAEALGIDHVISNRLEIHDGRATGRLLQPVVAGTEKLKVVQNFAMDHGIRLENSYAFADSKADSELLDAVGYPCAVNPDPGLRKLAHEKKWPILNFA